MPDDLISIVIPCRNEAENLPLLLEEIEAAMTGRAFEVIVIDDGSTDDTGTVLAAQAARRPFPVRRLKHEKSAGQSLSVRSGAWAARGGIVATIDGDGQNDPQYIPVLVDALVEAGPQAGAAQGQRLKRRDSKAKQLASRFANWLRNAILHDETRDTGCGLKAVRTDVLRRLPFFDGTHRYVPALVIQEGTFRKIDDGLFLQVGERLPDNRLGGIFVADSREEGVNLVYYAKSGAIVQRGDEKVLMMNDGVIHRKTMTGDLSVIRFTSYAFDLSAFMSAASEVTLMPEDRTTQYLLNPDPNDKAFQQNPNEYRAELNQRFTEWTYSLVFALIALAVAGDARSHREARVHPLITAIGISLFVRWLGFFAAGKADTVPQYAYMVYGVPIVSAAIAIWFIVTSRTMELPMSWADRMTNLAGRVAEFWNAIRLRVLGRGAPGREVG